MNCDKKNLKSRYCGLYSNSSLKLVRKFQLFRCKSKGEWVEGRRNYDRTNTGHGEEGRRKNRNHHHHHKRQGLGPLARSVSRVTAAPSISSLVFQFSSFLVGCTGVLSRGFGFVAFFVGVRTISLCIRLACRGC